MRERLCKRCEVADISMRAPNARYCYDCSYFKTVEPYSYGKLKEENERLRAMNADMLAALRWAKAVIKEWHAFGRENDEVPPWEDYTQGKEMEPIHIAIAKAEAKEHA